MGSPKIDFDPRNSSIGKPVSALFSGNLPAAGGEALKSLGDAASLNQQLLGGALSGVSGLRGQWEAGEAEQRRANDLKGQQDQAAWDWQREQDRQSSNALGAKNKMNTDYIEKYNKGIADQEALSALEDARAATRRSRGRQINFG